MTNLAKRVTISLALLALGSSVAAPQPSRISSGVALARAAQRQVGVTVLYDPAYRRLDYPGGDVPIDRGVCSDVVVRAFRTIGIDLQVELHEDMKRNFQRYPRLWGLSRTDRNIDHRRVPNLMTFFERRGKSLALTERYEPGDVVAWRLPNGLHHIGLVAESRTRHGHPLVIHNIGQGARSEDVLHAFEKLGHYRW